MAKKAPTSRIYIAAGGALAVIIILCAMLPQADNVFYSTLSSGAKGTKAVFLLLEKEGQKVERAAGFVPPGSGLAILLEPAGRLSAEDRDRLLEWMTDGNTVLLAGDQPNLLYRYFGFWPEPALSRPPIASVSSSHQLLQGVGQLALVEGTRVNDAAAADFQYGDDQGAYLGEVVYGKGRMVFLTVPGLLSNQQIGEQDNLILFLNIVRLYGGAGIWFCEGTGVKSGHAAQRALLGPLALTGGQFILGLLLLYYFWGKRFGRAISLTVKDKQLTGSYVSSLAVIYRQARARHLIFESIYQGFREDLARYLGMPSSSSNDELIGLFSSRANIDAQKLGDLLNNSEQILVRPDFTEDELLAIVREMESWREDNLSFKAKRGKDNG